MAAHASGKTATHLLLWIVDHPVLVQVEELPGGTEISFDYGPHCRAVAADTGPRAIASAREEDMEMSLSLSTGSEDSLLEGLGQVTEKKKMTR